MKNKKNKSSLFKWLKRIFAFLGVLILIILLYVRFTPDIKYVDDSFMKITYPDIPDEQNGYLLLNQAMGPQKEKFEELEGLEDLRKLTPQAAEKIRFKYKERFEIIDRAISLPHTLTPKITDYSPSSPFPNFMSIRNLVKMRLALAWLEFKKGNKQEALNEVLKMLKVGQLFENSNGVLICYMFGNAIKRESLNMLYYMFSEHDISEEITSNWIKFLTDFNENRESLEISYKDEYWFADNIIKILGTGKILEDEFAKSPWVLSNNFIRPFIFKPNKTRKKIIDFYTPIIESSQKYFYKDMDFVDLSFFALNKPFSLIKSFLGGNIMGELMLAVAIPNFNKVLGKRCYNDFLLEATRIRLVLLAFKNKNDTFPETLEKLVPEYLSETPADPFDGKPIRYNKEKNILYSVGPDLKDDGGNSKNFIFITDSKLYDMYEEKDLVMKIEQQ